MSNQDNPAENTLPKISSRAAETAISGKGKSTPGPWSTYTILQPSENHRGWEIAPKRGNRVAAVYPMCTEDGSDPSEEAQANARLIAAAPDLLAALKRCLSLLEKGPVADAARGSGLVSARQGARDAIANAEKEGTP